ncbi:hypothetical protein Clacol_001556 [Clathrus columnatus]|uniref:Uncharacterized protein n=1 Tax=Clathrus columnatus TaxID=1419009 RepID=A0AAV5A2X5_9AGAM|nr:hypothetical protein Clacol_001556 [Clathrus columnatus]
MTKDLISLGMFIIDDVVFAYESEQVLQNRSSQIGGGGTYAVIGARMFLNAQDIGMIVDKGEDFTDHIENALLSFGKDMWYFRSREGPTTRATNTYFDQNRRPNAEEAFAFLNITASVTKSSVEAACHRFIELGNTVEPSKSSLTRYVIIRCGSMGACMASSTSSSCIWVEAFWQSSDRDMIKDVTGAGNAFLGGLAAEIATSQENVENLSDNNLQVEPDDKWCLHADGAYKPIGAIESGDVLKPLINARSGQNPLEVLPTENEAFLDNLEGLDWSAIARDVSTWNHPGEPRTAQECEGRWLSLHPKLNYEAWSDEETKNLQEIVQNKRASGDLDWNAVAETLGTSRTGLDCIRQYQTCNKTPFKWTDELDKKLLAAVEKYGYSNWVLVAPAVSLELSPNQCQIRYERTLNPALKHGKFTPEEDELLLKAIEIFGCEWRKVAQMIPGRGNTQCRSRYLSLNRQKERQVIKRTEKTSTPTPAPAIEVPSGSNNNNENTEPLTMMESTEGAGVADTVLPTIVEVAEPPPKKRPKPRPTAVSKSSDTLKSTHSMRTRSTAKLT